MKPFPRQQAIHDRTKDLRVFALLWEMRVGKTWPMVKLAEYHFNKGNIDAVVVLAPSGVSLNWARRVLPQLRPSDHILEWSSTTKGTKTWQDSAKKKIADKSELLWLCMNLEALTTDAGKKFLMDLLKARKCLGLIDEAHGIKNPGAKRTKFILSQAPKFVLRRILTGTNAPNSPFDVWSQYQFLDPGIFNMKFTTFKQRYGIFKRVRFGGPAFDKLEGYRDLDHLWAKIAPYSDRLTQKEAGIEIPSDPQVRYFEMSEEQRTAYYQMKEEMMVELASGRIINAKQAITQLLRLAQISRGFIQQGEEVVDLGVNKPSINSLMDLLSNTEGKVIIWCKNRYDIEAIMKAADREGYKMVRYDGGITAEQRVENYNAFVNDPKVKAVAGTLATGAEGIDWSCAPSIIFYSHTYNLKDRLQGLARNQGVNQKAERLLVVDMVCSEGVDEACLDRLEMKENILHLLSGDKLSAAVRAILTGKE